jgi:hypothetical protein
MCCCGDRCFEKRATAEGKTPEELEAELRGQAESGAVSTQYTGPSAWAIAAYAQLAAWRDSGHNAGVGVLRMCGVNAAYREQEWVPNIPHIVDVLMRVHGTQLVSDGLFNADPNGGNFLLLPDGRLGLIDYGATKRLTREERLLGACLYAALGRRDEKTVKHIVMLSGYKSKYNRQDVIMKMMQFGYQHRSLPVSIVSTRDPCHRMLHLHTPLKFNDSCVWVAQVRLVRVRGHGRQKCFAVL